jgi:hypothetical protein
MYEAEREWVMGDSLNLNPKRRSAVERICTPLAGGI